MIILGCIGGKRKPSRLTPVSPKCTLQVAIFLVFLSFRYLQNSFPPCKAHLLLVEMFENGKITAKTTPKEAFSFHAEFSRFSMAVFSNNFRQLKLLNGLECMSHFFNLLLFYFTLIHFILLQ
jgi:hypothetical protein